MNNIPRSCLLSFKAHGYEMKDRTWSDRVCGEMIEMIMPIRGGLNECKRKCDMKESCTAIEYSKNVVNVESGKGEKCCVLRECPLPVPVPDVAQAEWHGGKSKYVGYVKRKYDITEVVNPVIYNGSPLYNYK